MKLFIIVAVWLTLAGILQQASAQTNKDKAYDLGMQAIKLEDNGNISDAIKLLEQAQKLDPKDIDYPYEIGYAYYINKDYKKAEGYIESVVNSPDANDRVFELLGNCYDNLNKGDKAIAMYQKGLDKFPKSGRLYLEIGIAYLGKKDYDKAINDFESGIKLQPEFPSNYYWAAKLYCNSSEEVWGMIYGEIFMNLERDTKRTAEISKLLYDTYKSQIKISSDTSYFVSFSKNASMSLNDMSDAKRLPFGVGVYEPTLTFALIHEKVIDINSLDRIRKNFVESYFKNDHDLKYPNVLFEYQKKVLKADQLEAYNHWVLMKGDDDAFAKWQSANKEKWDNFIKWFTDNPIGIDASNHFYRGQY